jgi:hypothetical protein
MALAIMAACLSSAVSGWEHWMESWKPTESQEKIEVLAMLGGVKECDPVLLGRSTWRERMGLGWNEQDGKDDKDGKDGLHKGPKGLMYMD